MAKTYPELKRDHFKKDNTFCQFLCRFHILLLFTNVKRGMPMKYKGSLGVTKK